MKLQQVRTLNPGLLIPLLLWITSCSLCIWGPKAPERNFTIEDLLLTKEDLPEIWYPLGHPEKPLQVDGEILASDALGTHFLTGKTPGESLYHKVYRFRYIHTAGKEFQNQQEIILKTLWHILNSEAIYQSKSADNTLYICNKDTKHIHYIYMGSYEEFLIVVHVFANESMSGDEFKKIIDILDTRMTELLQR